MTETEIQRVLLGTSLVIAEDGGGTSSLRPTRYDLDAQLWLRFATRERN